MGSWSYHLPSLVFAFLESLHQKSGDMQCIFIRTVHAVYQVRTIVLTIIASLGSPTSIILLMYGLTEALLSSSNAL